MPSRLQIDFKDNPDLAELLSGMAPGEKFTLEVELTTVLNDTNGISADIDTVFVETESDGDEDLSAETTPTNDRPVSLVMLGSDNEDAD